MGLDWKHVLMLLDQLKTLVSLMHRKYSRDNLRIGRSSSPPAKTVLFCDND